MGLQSGLARRSFFLYSNNTVLGMPDGRFSIIDEKPFRVHPIQLFRRRCSLRAGSHANRLKQTTHFLLLGPFFKLIFKWVGSA